MGMYTGPVGEYNNIDDGIMFVYYSVSVHCLIKSSARACDSLSPHNLPLTNLFFTFYTLYIQLRLVLFCFVLHDDNTGGGRQSTLFVLSFSMAYSNMHVMECIFFSVF